MLEGDPAHRDVDGAVARRIDLQCVGAAEVDRRGRRRLDEEFAGWRPDERVHGTARQRQAVVAGRRGDELHPRVRVNLHEADVADVNRRTRIAIRLEPLADGQPAAVGDRRGIDDG